LENTSRKHCVCYTLSPFSTFHLTITNLPCFPDRYAQELNLTSMLHLKVMLRQMLTSEQIPNAKEWEEVLLKLALRIARELTFTSLPHRQGEDMDVRKYVKIKKIPGGAPSDSEYVEGAVITKNVAHKQMQRSIRNPRIMLVTFPLEFHRIEGQYMHFGQIVRQEKEYLGNLASRIAALRPHVVLVEQSVSRLALDALAHSRIAVARSVKASAIQTIARMTQGDVFSSMDKLALEPRLGHCANFKIRTYDHPLIPGRRKTYMRFEGCSRDMGCTIILRGANIDILRRLKKVTRFLTFIVRNLKLETHLWKDSVITLHPINPDAVPPSTAGRSPSDLASAAALISPTSASPSRALIFASQAEKEAKNTDVDSDSEDHQDDNTHQIQLSRRIDQSLDAYIHTFISVSATLRFPPPYPLRRMKELDNDLAEAKQKWEDEVIQREERMASLHTQEVTVTGSTPMESAHPLDIGDANDLSAQIEALPSIILSGTQPLTETPMSISGMPEGTSYFLYPGGSASTTDTPNAVAINTASTVQLVPGTQKTSDDIKAESKYTLLKWKHEEQRRIWEWYLRKNPDDFVVEKYQCISLWQFTLPTIEVGKHQPCFAPQLIYTTFYGENDCTLGQFIERSVNENLAQFLDPKAICTGKGCDKPLARHCMVFVHNESRITIAVEQWDGQIIGRHHPSPESITTWSACRLCGSATPFIPVSEEMQRYSFAKFLELHFYPADVQLVQGAGCLHNIYQHHVRFFACNGLTVRFQSDSITLNEVVFPPFKIRVRPETQLQIKNSDFERLHQRNLVWYSALTDDLKLISIDAATGDEGADAKLLADINSLIVRAERERDDICRLINRVYNESSPMDTLALNQIHAYRQDKIVAWQQDFDRLPKPRPPPLGDRRNNRSSAFGSVRAMWPRKYDFAGTFDNPIFPSSHNSEAEGHLANRRVTGDSFLSSASEASESENNEEAQPTKADPLPYSPSPPPIPPEATKDNTEIKDRIDENGSAFSEEKGQPSEDVQASQSEAESDSTIGAGRDEHNTNISMAVGSFPLGKKKLSLNYLFQGGPLTNEPPAVPRPSRLPRRADNAPTVADLVRKYQDFLPAQGVHELSKTALSPSVAFSESEQEYIPIVPRRLPTRTKHKHHLPPRKASTSDFEQSYAANIAPRYLTPSRRLAGTSSRIPGPKNISSSTVPSRSQSRRPSPEKRSSDSRLMVKETHPSRPGSPTGFQQPTATSKGKQRRVAQSKERPSQIRSSQNTGPKSGPRRPPTLSGNKVSSMAKHFERIGRDAERARSRYTVIRGKRARPVASARAKVEVLESIKDVIRDESESSDSSSEADDEDEGIDEEREQPVPAPLLLSEDTNTVQPEIHTAPPVVEVSDSNDPVPIKSETQELTVPVASLDPVSLPPSPFLAAGKKGTSTPPLSDAELPGGGSILRVISGLWLNSNSRLSFEDDPLNDPEHIFRDSSMIVRTDEPTSIIALALK
jgi:1-phosphatidylinositol-3-phosphate 5-kinase